MQAVRSFFIARDYIEADTPVRLPVLLPEAHIKPVRAEGGFLQTSPEICMKRLLALGCERLFQVCRCFRREEIGALHQEEFTMLEWYRAGWSYTELMRECEEFVRALARSGSDLAGAAGPDALVRGGRTIDLLPPWDRITVAEAFRRFAAIEVRDALARDLFDEVLVTRIEPHLGWDRPVFLHDYPVELGSLARSKPGDQSVAERFELYIAGIEIANGFSELVDPVEQRNRFEQELAKSAVYGSLHSEMPEKFLRDLERLSDTAGIALGLDRLFMLLMGCNTVAGAMTFSSGDL